MSAKKENPSPETPAARGREQMTTSSTLSLFAAVFGILGFNKDGFSSLGIGLVLFSGILLVISLLSWKSVPENDRFRNGAIGQFFGNSAFGRWVLVVLSGSVLALTFVSTFFGWPVNLRPGCDIAGEITNQADGDLVGSLVDVRGHASCFEEQSLWLLLQAPNNQFYSTAQAPLQIIDNKWSQNQIGIGTPGAKDSNKAYTLYLVAARREGDPIQRKMLDEQMVHPYVSFPSLPEEIQVLNKVKVRKKAA